jgi:glutamine amidotransferase
MCRHLAYLGPPVALSRLLFDPPHSLAHQAWAPREMRGSGTINADGFGVGWFPGRDRGAGPLRYRRDRPIWTDPDLPGLAAGTAASAALAAVRSASPGMPVVATACAPFAGDGWLFSLNGRVAGWPDSAAALAQRLPVTDLLTLPAPVDAAWLWALLRHRLRGGATPAEAVVATVVEVAAAAPGSQLNLLLAGPDQIVATTAGHSLAVRYDGGSVLVSSEPLDGDPAWRAVPDRVLVVATLTGVDLAPLPTGPAPLPTGPAPLPTDRAGGAARLPRSGGETR